jgi:Prenyltransferase and squalene oxidase repeat
VIQRELAGATDGTIELAIDHGLEFVLAAQQSDGAWSDWMLPPGASLDWTTADVGLSLLELGAEHRTAIAGPVGSAARWLISREAIGGGWGYNRAVDPDADTTARALLFLAGAGFRGAPASYTFLARHQLADGGFATFLPSVFTGSWGISHPETTPVALLALLSNPNGLPEDRVSQGLAWLRGVRRSDGLWYSFWWSTPLMSTEVNVSLRAELGTRTPLPSGLRQLQPQRGREMASLLSIACASMVNQVAFIGQVARRLAEDQRADGSWSSPPMLRVTSRGCERPWDATNPPGALYADDRRVHTTAAVIAALAKARTVLAASAQSGR